MTWRRFEAAKTWLRLWLRNLLPKRNRRPYRRFGRPCLEGLEDRLAPAAVSWTGDAGDLSWGDAANWSNNAVPTSADDVTINKSGVGTIGIGAGNYAVRSLNDSTAALSIATGGTLSLAAVAASSTLGQNVTVKLGAALEVGASASVQIGTGVNTSVTLTDDGTLTFAGDDTVTFNINGYFGATAQIVVGSGGLMTASGDAFNNANNWTTQILVNAGGELQAGNSTFDISQLTLADGSILNDGDLTNNVFNLPLFVPAIDVPLLTNNQSFRDVEINAGDSLASGKSVTLTLMGTVSTANLLYILPGNFTINQGATLAVASNIPVQFGTGVDTSVTLTDDGTLTFAGDDTVTFNINGYFGATAQIVVGSGGLMTASGDAFNNANNWTTKILVNSRGQLNVDGGTFGLSSLTLNAGSTDTVQFVDYLTQLDINSSATFINIFSNDFSSVATNGIIASGDPKATIHLPNNYWGTTDPTAIADKILDHAKDPTRPTVVFEPPDSAKPVQTTAAAVSTTFNLAAQNVTLTAALISPSGRVNEGTVTFTVKNGGTTIGTAQGTVSNGTTSAGFTLPAGLAAGSYTIAVSYSDSAGSFMDGGDINAILAVNPDNVTTTAHNASAIYSTNTQTVALSAAVADATIPTDTVDEGTVTFTVKNGGTTIGTAQGTVSNGTANARFTLPAGQAAGIYTIAVGYSDSAGNFADGGDANAKLTITTANVTTNANNVSAAYSPNAQTVALSAAVADATIPTDTVDEGTVAFTVKNGGTTIGTAQGTVSGGTANASFHLPAGQAAGIYTIAVGYSDSAGNFTDKGDTNATLTVTVANVTTTAHNASAIYSPNTQTVALSAAVADASIPTDAVDEGTVAFTVKNGGTTVGTAQGTVSNGTANASFSLPAGQAAGSYTIAVSYSDNAGNFTDSGDTNATLTVQLTPTVTTNPSNQMVTAGETATFTAAANGYPTPTVQWQVSIDGGKTFTNISGATSTMLTLTNVTADMNGDEYHAVFTNGAGSATSSAATLTVQFAPIVMTNPSSQTNAAGQNISFTVAANGNPTPTVQWQVSTDGGDNFTNISGATSTTLTLTNVTADMNGDEYQAAFTNSIGTTTSSVAILTVQYVSVVTNNPSSQTITAGQNVTFTVAANGNPTPTVQWQVSSDGGKTFTNIIGATANTLTLNNVTAGMNGSEYQAVFTNSIGSSTSSIATLTVQYVPALTTNPTSQTVTAGGTAAFTAAANGDPTPTVQWQVSSDGGKTFTNIIGATANTLTLNNVTAGMNGSEYQAVFTNSIGSSTSSIATLTVQYAPAVTTNPTSQTITAGGTATFTVAANGNPSPTVQWQVSRDGGKTFTNIIGAASNTLTLINVSLSLNGREYRAEITNALGTSTTTAALLTVQSAPAITSGNSSDFSVGQGGSFIVIATGSPAPELTESGALPSGVIFTNNGDGTASLHGAPAAGSNGTYFVMITAHNGVGSDASQIFTLTVNSAAVSPSPAQPPTLNVPPLLAFFDALLGAIETVNADDTETVVDSFLGISLIVATYDGSGNFVSATLFGFTFPNWLWNL